MPSSEQNPEECDVRPAEPRLNDSVGQAFGRATDDDSSTYVLRRRME
jgi:hypothetical protein